MKSRSDFVLDQLQSVSEAYDPDAPEYYFDAEDFISRMETILVESKRQFPQFKDNLKGMKASIKLQGRKLSDLGRDMAEWVDKH